MNYNIKFKERPFKFEGTIYAPNKNMINSIFEELDVKNYRIIDEEEMKEERTFEITPCHNSVFKGIDCLEDENRIGFFKSYNDIRSGHAIWIDKEDAERIFELIKESIENDRD